MSDLYQRSRWRRAASQDWGRLSSAEVIRDAALLTSGVMALLDEVTTVEAARDLALSALHHEERADWEGRWRLAEAERDAAMLMHNVQYDRANRIEAQMWQLQTELAETRRAFDILKEAV